MCLGGTVAQIQYGIDTVCPHLAISSPLVICSFSIHGHILQALSYTSWGVGVGYGTNSTAYMIDFPIGRSDYLNGWIYKDDESKTVGVKIKF